MRGDSLRDFYAKSIALLGLGLLGGIGAAVDYWPTGVTVPKMTAHGIRVAGIAPLPARELPEVSVASPAPAPAPARAVAVLASARIVQPPVAFRTVSFIPKPSPRIETLESVTPSTFNGFGAALETDIALPTLEVKPEVFSITAVAEAQPTGSDQKGVLAGLVSSAVDGSKKGGAAMANGLQAFGGAVGSAMKAGAGGLLGLFGRHDQKRQETGALMFQDFPR